MNLFDQLRSKGYRITSPREKILNEIYEHPLTIREIYISLQHKKEKINLASVYRTVTVFLQNGIVQELDFGDGKKRYELINKENHHHHIMCNKCKKIEDITLAEESNLLREVYAKSNFKITKHSLEFFGLCGRCQ